jgi:hypothetical protein
MTKLCVFIAMAAVCLAGPMLEAQRGGAAQGTPAPGIQMGMVFSINQADQDAQLVVAGPPVLDAPYSATGTTEFTLTLGDGTHIKRESAYTIARDSLGRLRRESGDSIWISDPVAQVTHVLTPSTHAVAELPYSRMGRRGISPTMVNVGRGGRGGARGGDGTAAGARGVNPSHPSPALGRGDQIGSTVGDRRGGRGGRTGGGAAPASLGHRTIEGLDVVGTRAVSVIPVGQIGNDREIDVTSERWYSDDLQIVVMSRTSDPRTGETTFQMTGIRRAEPSAALFIVPAGYRPSGRGM